MGERGTRVAAWFALGFQPIYCAYWLAAGATEPHYSPIDSFVSEMGVPTMARPWLLDLMLVLWGVSIIAAGIAIRGVLRGPAGSWAAGLLIVAGVAIALAGPLHMSCVISLHPHCAGDHSFTQVAHHWLSLISQFALTFSAFAVAAALWPDSVGKALFVPAVLAVIWLILGFFAGPTDPHAGLFQRLGIVAAQGWIMILGAWALVVDERRTIGARPPG